MSWDGGIGDLPGMKAGRKRLIAKRRFEAWLDGDSSR